MNGAARQLPDKELGLEPRVGWTERFNIDLLLLAPLLLVTGLGLMVLYSANSEQSGPVLRQLAHFAVAYLFMFAIAQVGMHRYRRWTPWAYLTGLVLLLWVAFAGVGEGSRRWLDLFGFRFQPSELMKLLLPLILAWYLAPRAEPPNFRQLVVSAVLIGLPSGLVLVQPDLGTALLIACAGLSVLFMAGISWSYIGGAALVALLSAWPIWNYLLYDYQRQRVLTTFNPERDRLGVGWNIIQSKTAVGSGGWTGKGWTRGTQSHLDFLPETSTDFVVAVLAEEFGLRGILLLLLLYLLILMRGCWISWFAQDGFSRLVAGSLTLLFALYIFVNMGMVSGLLPVVGVPLPLVSAGGTSLVTLMAGFGILMAINSEERLMQK